ncbi:MAG: type II toxin-antitoxin system RelE/ParE family toxin [Deltaproteobacteria bacterium]|nr:type II toxin-antitoxin system RelE/ParE family toxin [Deltaproteobacteria bacterium]
MIIQYTSHFLKEFKKLPKGIRELAVQQEAIFRADPHDPRLHAKPLKGRLKGFFSFRVTRNYRVLFTWKDKENVLFYEIGDRKFIYD